MPMAPLNLGEKRKNDNDSLTVHNAYNLTDFVPV